MSAIAAAPKRKSKRRNTPWDPPAFHETSGPGLGTITVRHDDPMQSLASPTPSIGQRLDAELDRLTQLTSELRDTVVETSPRPAPAAPRTNARDAWCAVIIMGLFIAAGIAWTTNRLTEAGREVAALTQQIEEKDTAIVHYQQEIKRLRSELLAARLEARQNARSAK